MMTKTFVDELRTGERFLWCGRQVLVKRIDESERYVARGPSRYLTVVIDDHRSTSETLRLHYFDSERVVRVGP